MAAQYHFSQMWNLIPDLKVRVTKLRCNNWIFINVTFVCLLKLVIFTDRICHGVPTFEGNLKRSKFKGMVTAKIQICFLTFGSNKGFSHGQCRSFYNRMVYLLICALLLCKIAFVLFVEISVQGFARGLSGMGAENTFFPVNYSLRLFRCRNNAKNLMKGLLSSS